MNRRDFLKSAAALGICATIGAKVVETGTIETVSDYYEGSAFKPYHQLLPELWSQEILDTYKKNLVMSSLLDV